MVVVHPWFIRLAEKITRDCEGETHSSRFPLSLFCNIYEKLIAVLAVIMLLKLPVVMKNSAVAGPVEFKNEAVALLPADGDQDELIDQLDVIWYVEAVVKVVPPPLPGAHEALVAKLEVTE